MQSRTLLDYTADPPRPFMMAMVEELVNAFVLPDSSPGSSIDIDDLAAELAAFEWNGIRPGTRG